MPDGRHQLILPAALACAAFSLAAPAMAQDEPPQENTHLKAMRECQAVASDMDRLACYDRAVGELVAATDQGELKVVDREEVRQTKRKLFGFTLPDFGIFGGSKDKDDDAEEEISALETTIVRANRSRTGGWIVETTEGAVWELTEVPRRLLDPKAGQAIEIRKASLGTYFLRINGQPGVRGRRVE